MGLRSLSKQLLAEWSHDYPIRGFLVGIGYSAGKRQMSDTVQIAAAIELAQLATVIIDDVVDESEIRIGQSAFKRFGANVCIMAGDILKTCSTSVLLRSIEARKTLIKPLYALQRLEATYRDVCLGQLMDICFEGNQLIKVSKYLCMISYTTGGFLRGAIDVGTILAGVPQEIATILSDYAWSLGMAFQIYDDILDLLPQRSQLKTHAQDIRRRKQRLPLILYLQSCGKREKAAAEAILQKSALADTDVRNMVRAVTESGALRASMQMGKKFSLDAKHLAQRLPMHSCRAKLLALVDFLQPDMDEAIVSSARKSLRAIAE